MGSSFFETTNGGALSTAGRSIVGLDLNGDGIDDTVVAAGNVSVIYGDAGGFETIVDLDSFPSSAGFTLTWEDNIVFGEIGDEFGYAVAKAENLQGPGTPTGTFTDALLIGARATGIVSVVFTGTETVGMTVTGLPILANGMSLAGLGDFNGDGIGDFAIGAPDANTDDGAVYVIYGGNTLGATIDVADLDGTNGFVINGFGDNDYGGTSIAGGFDFDGDGANDLLIGAPGVDDTGIGGDEAGAAYIIYGTPTVPTTPLAAQSIATTTDYRTTEFTGFGGDKLGSTVSAGPDINGDGIDDIIIGAPFASGVGSTYVVFGGTTPQTTLEDLDGTDGFAIDGVSVASLEMLGDVSGDGIGDLGIVSTTGDVYIVFGIDTLGPDGVFDPNVDVTMLNGVNGIALTGLFAGTPSSVSIAALGDVNSDPSGPVGDIGIIATYNNGTPTASFTVLGGTKNFDAMDAADSGIGAATDGTIDFAAITTPIEFVDTVETVVLSGSNAATIDEDTVDVSGAIEIKDENDTAASFKNATAIGAYGGFLVNTAGTSWTYTVSTVPANLDFLNVLDAGDVIFDSGTFTASNGTKREVTITINGVDDVAMLSFATDAGPPTEDNAQFSGVITLTDPDADDSPVIIPATVVGAHGNIVVAANGTFTYFLTDASVQGTPDGASTIDTITLTADDGNTYDITVTIAGADEGIPMNFSDIPNAPDTIFTSFGNDIINALAGNDFINAGGGNDIVDAGEGDDTVVDSLGDDNVTGGKGNDNILLLSGNNIVDAGIGNDLIVTGFGYDRIDAGEGNDVIAADEGSIFIFGNNRITGGGGDDYLMGGMGVDVFVFDDDDGIDTIGAFDPNAVTLNVGGEYDVISSGRSFQLGIDKIEISGLSTAQQNSLLDGLETATGPLAIGATSSINLVNITLSDLTETDFIFV